MGLLKRLAPKHAVIGDDGRPHCPVCDTDLTGQPAPASATAPLRCPGCRTNVFPDLRGRTGFRRRD